MILRSGFFFLFIFLFFESKDLQGQWNTTHELIWKIELNDESKDKFTSNFTRLAKCGYKINQQALDSNLFILHVTDIHNLTKSLKRRKEGIELSYNGHQSTINVTRNEIRDQLSKQFNDFLTSQIPKVFPNRWTEYRKQQQQKFRRLLKGKGSYRYWKDSIWNINLGRVEKADFSQSYIINILSKKKKYVSIQFDTIPASNFSQLKAYDLSPCGRAIDRTTYFRNHLAMNYQGLKYRPYKPRSGITRKKSFKLFFEQGKSDYKEEDVGRIVKYLSYSNLVITSARIKAYASIEGDTSINMGLQRQRAEVLVNTLEKVNNDSISTEITTFEDWTLWNKQLANSIYDSAYSKTEWKILLKNDSIQNHFDSFLKKQRRAELELTLTQRLTPEQRLRIAKHDFRKYASRYPFKANQDIRTRHLKRLFGIWKYMEMQTYSIEADSGTICSLSPHRNYEFHITRFYETVKHIKSKGSLLCNNLGAVILQANEAVLELYLKNPKSRFYLQQALDVQSFAYELATIGTLDASIVCQFYYPDKPTYYPLILNQLHFYDSNEWLITNLPCVSTSYNNIYQKEYYASLSNNKPSTPEYNRRYHYLLKKIVITNDQSIQELVDRSDHILRFDLIEFLYANINMWDPWKNLFFDDEVNMEVMAAQIKRLNKIRGNHCDKQIDQLILNFYLKVLHTSIVKDEKDEICEEAVAFISGYYLRHADKMDEFELMKTIGQLSAINQVYFKNEPVKKILQILETKNRTTSLTGAPKEIYLNLVSRLK